MRKSHPMMAATAEVKAFAARIPKERWTTKIRNLMLGGVLIGLGTAGAAKWAWPWYVVVPVVFAGSHIVSSAYTKAAVIFITTMVKEILSAVKGSKQP